MGPRVLTVGDNVVDTYPQQSVMYPGGNAVNVAVHVRRLGVDSGYVGAVGDDTAGRLILSALQAEQVDTTRLRVREGANAYAVVEIVEGNRVFTEGHLGVSVFTLDELDLKAAADVDLVHTGECSHLEDQLGDLAGVARRLSFDFSERDWDYIEQHAGHVSVAIRSSPDGDLEHALAQAERLRALGPSTVAVTMGDRGALVLQERPTYRPAPAGRVVDTLGAGDAFIARLLVALVREEQPVEDVLASATAYATASCASFGAFGYAAPTDQTSIPLPEQPSRPDRLETS